MVAALAPETETFSAELVNEGCWLTEAHLNAVETELGNNASAIKKAGEDLAAANTAKDTAEASLKTANDNIATQKTEIENLKAENEKLKTPAADPKASAPENDPQATPPADPKAKYRMGIDETAEKYATKK